MVTGCILNLGGLFKDPFCYEMAWFYTRLLVVMSTTLCPVVHGELLSALLLVGPAKSAGDVSINVSVQLRRMSASISKV